MKRFATLIALLWALCLPASAQAIKTLADSLSAGQWGTLTGVVDQPLHNGESVTGEHLTFAHNGIWETTSKKVYYIGVGHGVLNSGPWVFKYDPVTNAWVKLFQLPASAGIGHGYDHSVYDPWRRRIYHRGYAQSTIYGWDTATDTWLGSLTTAPYDLGNVAEGVAWFDGLYGSGLSSTLTQGGVLVYSGENPSFTQSHIWEPNKGTGSGAWSEINNVIVPGPGGANYHTWSEYSRPYNVTFMGGGNNQPRKVAVINANRTVTAVTDAPIDVRIQGANAVVDPRSGKLLIYGQGQMWELGLNAGGTAWVWTQLAAPPSAITADSGLGNPSSPDLRSIISTPISDYGVIYWVRCQGFNPCRHYLYKHAESDFDIRARASGVLSARKMDTEADLYYAWDNSSSVLNTAMSGRTRFTVGANKATSLGNIAGLELGGAALFPVIDRTVKPNSSSAGSLLFRVPSQSPTLVPYLWEVPIEFNDRTSPWKYIAPGSPDGNVLWLQFKMRGNTQYLVPTGEVCGGGPCSPKFQITYGNPPNGSNASSIEDTWVIDGRSDRFGLRIPTMYGQIGHDDSFPVQINCTSSPYSNCVKLSSDTWYTFTTKYTVNPPPYSTLSVGNPSGCNGGTDPLSRVEAWIGTTKVQDNPCVAINYGSSDGNGLGSITFLPYATARTPTAHAEGRLWIADVIVSTSSIALTPGGDTTPPAAPSGVIIR